MSTVTNNFDYYIPMSNVGVGPIAIAGTNPNFWLNAVLVRDRATRDQWLKDFNAQGVMMRPVWELMSDLPMYTDCTRDGLEVARSLANRLVNMPSGVPV